MAVINGDSGNNLLRGTRKADEINGRAGKDTIEGRGGDDTIEGGRGNDDLSGGGGRDEFVFEVGSGRDFIFDFQDDQDTLYIDSDYGVITHPFASAKSLAKSVT